MVATMEDLLNMKNDIVPPMANHSRPNTVETNGASVVDDGKADWELALVEVASNLSKQQSSCGLDPVCAPPVLALPAPNEKKPVVNLQDPFAASLMVSSLPYVQLADMEKKRGFIVQEQQKIWQSYGSNAIKVSGGVAAYNAMEQQAGLPMHIIDQVHIFNVLCIILKCL
ncbi:hypothetical protein R6Q57_029171 [Mikania cordata]